MIHVDFDTRSNFIPENDEKKNPDEPYTNKHQNHFGCSYGYKLASVDNRFSKHFKSYLGQDTVHRFMTNIIKKSRYCSPEMEKHFNEELVKTKEDYENFKSSKKCWICSNTFVEDDVKVKDHYHITGKLGVQHTGKVISTSV